jgi:hypothetical protein
VVERGEKMGEILPSNFCYFLELYFCDFRLAKGGKRNTGILRFAQDDDLRKFGGFRRVGGWGTGPARLASVTALVQYCINTCSAVDAAQRKAPLFQAHGRR